MNEVIYYIQHAVFSGSEKISIAHIVPVFLPIIGVLVLWGVLAYYRGQKIKIITALIIYIVLTMIIPLSIYIYSAFYLSSSPVWMILAQFTMFLGGMLLLPYIFQRYSYKTDDDYIASKARVNYSNKPLIFFPNKLGALLISYYFVAMFAGFIIFGVLWLYASSHQYVMILPFAITATTITGGMILIFYVFVRLFPRCPYCKFGLLDMDFRYNPPTQEEKNIYTRQFYKTLWNVLRLKPFSCRYCKAPFVLRKQDL